MECYSASEYDWLGILISFCYGLLVMEREQTKMDYHLAYHFLFYTSNNSISDYTSTCSYSRNRDYYAYIPMGRADEKGQIKEEDYILHKFCFSNYLIPFTFSYYQKE